MNGINRAGPGHRARHAERHSCRPGSSDRPGRRCGHFKHRDARMDATTTENAIPLVLQQLNALNTSANTANSINTSANANSFSNALDANTFATQMMIMNDLKQTNAMLTEQMRFLSRFGAISTAF